MNLVFPRQGEIYLIQALKIIGDTKKRPAVVVSIDIRNQFSRTVLVVPFTSDLTSGETSTRVLLSEGEGGLLQDSFAVCDNFLAVRKLSLEQGPYDSISPGSLRRIQAGIQVAIGICP
jgi:mRNA interferase MazF